MVHIKVDWPNPKLKSLNSMPAQFSTCVVCCLCRQMVARSLLETIRVVGENEEEATMVLKAMVKLSDDTGMSTTPSASEIRPSLSCVSLS